MKITLGPIPFLWDKEKIITFYKEIANTPVTTVYIGEVVCSKRTILGRDSLERIGRMLQDKGKEVVLSTLSLITNREELEYVRSLVDLPFSIEINNIGVLNLISNNGDINRSGTFDPDRSGRMPDKLDKRLIAGPHLAVYNAPTAKFFSDLSIKRLVFMPELHKDAIESISSNIPSIEKEIIGFGNLPVAFSWRCYTVRALEMAKTNCAIVCKKHPEGMQLETMDGMPVFNINGTQLLSAQKACMIGQLDILEALGIEYLRIIPQERNTVDIINTFRKVIEGVITSQDAVEVLRGYAPEGLSNGWFHGQAGWEFIEKGNLEDGSGEYTQSYLQVYPQ